ncbi:MAG: L,D-transpeptidase family protein [Chitinophagaceae bacterium]|nr:L,D-transpeptidase family protein [Chitinophagaceae bacterium]
MASIRIILFFLFLTFSGQGYSQYTAAKVQRTTDRVSNAFENKEVQLKKEFRKKNLIWPAKYMYIRSFKYDSQLEVWVKNDLKEDFRLFKTYKICMMSGTMGPKRIEGDYQVPEGFYYITQFNPKSMYHLALGLNYPNASDKILSDQKRPGSGIYIHGSCVSVGCITVTDAEIEEIYVLASYAQEAGQDFVPVHVFPIRYDNKNSAEYLKNLYENNPGMLKFSGQLERAFNEFQANRKLPVVLIDPEGNYIMGS